MSTINKKTIIKTNSSHTQSPAKPREESPVKTPVKTPAKAPEKAPVETPEEPNVEYEYIEVEEEEQPTEMTDERSTETTQDGIKDKRDKKKISLDDLKKKLDDFDRIKIYIQDLKNNYKTLYELYERDNKMVKKIQQSRQEKSDKAKQRETGILAKRSMIPEFIDFLKYNINIIPDSIKKNNNINNDISPNLRLTGPNILSIISTYIKDQAKNNKDIFGKNIKKTDKDGNEKIVFDKSYYHLNKDKFLSTLFPGIETVHINELQKLIFKTIVTDNHYNFTFLHVSSRFFTFLHVSLRFFTKTYENL